MEGRITVFYLLYNMKFPDNLFGRELYIKDDQKETANKVNRNFILLNKNDTVDLGTYFNSFSPQKWSHYTTLVLLRVIITVNKKSFITVYGGNYKDSEVIVEKHIDSVNNTIDFLLEKISKYRVLGIKITALENDTIISNVKYEGEFKNYSIKKIGIGICTFHRENYLSANILVLKKFIDGHSNFRISISDNGNSISTYVTEHIGIYKNKNYGGSGGFTRTIIEEMYDDTRDYIILMDDDIKIDITTLERLNAFLAGLKPDFSEFIISGSMLQLDKPNYQVEHTAFLAKIFLHSIGRCDVSSFKNLVANEGDIKANYLNRYSGWWFSCLPVQCIKKYGLPLPLFIKGDDIEYSWRFGSKIITLNGIGVWHEKFSSKRNIVMDYFADRNMLLLQTVAVGTTRYTFLLSALLRLMRRIFVYRGLGIRMFELSITDFNKGFKDLIVKASDIKFAEVRRYSEEANHGMLISILNCFKNICMGAYNFNKLSNDNRLFIKKYLADKSFWQDFLSL